MPQRETLLEPSQVAVENPIVLAAKGAPAWVLHAAVRPPAVVGFEPVKTKEGPTLATKFTTVGVAPRASFSAPLLTTLSQTSSVPVKVRAAAKATAS